MKNQKRFVLLLGIFALLGLEAKPQKDAEQQKISFQVSEEEKELFKELRGLLKAGIEGGGEELREMLKENGIKRLKLKPKQARKKAKEFFDKAKEERIELLNQALSLAEQLASAESNDERLEIMKELSPILRKLPPPRKRPARGAR